MGLIFGQNREEKMMLESEKRQMDYGREQANKQLAQQDDYITQVNERFRADLMRWQQDLGDETENLRHSLKNEFLTEDGWLPKKTVVEFDDQKKPIFKDMPPLMNDMGIQMVLTEVQPLLSRNMINSNFSEERILFILKDTANTIADNLCDNHILFEADFVNFDVIVRLIKNVIIPAPYRALNDGERKHQRTTTKHLETISANDALGRKEGAIERLSH